MRMTNPRWSLAALALLLAAAAPATAAWAPFSGPMTPFVELHLDLGRPELLYARVLASSSMGYLWRSEDGGATWTDIQQGLGNSSLRVAIDPSDPTVIWVWTRDGQLWRSGDAGDTWSQRLSGSFASVFQLLVDPTQPSILYRLTGGNQGLSVDASYDGGASFQQGGPLPSIATSLVEARGDELLAFGNMGLQVSADGGQTWSVRGTYLGQGFAAGRIAPSAPNTMYATPLTSLPVTGCLARSDDAGAHWQQLPFPNLSIPFFGCNEIAIDAKDDRHLWVRAETSGRTGHQLSESKDGGETWIGPLLLPDDDPELSLVATGGESLYTGRYFSLDGGQTWARRDHGITAGDARFGLVAQDLPKTAAGLRLVALDGNPENGFDGVFQSQGGKSWKRIPQPVSFVVDAGAPVVVAGGDEGIVRSTDGGAHWTPVRSGPLRASDFRSDVATPRHLAVHAFEDIGDFGTLAFWTSDDAGSTWRRTSAGLPVTCVHEASVDTCINFSAYAVDPFNSRRRWVAAENSSFFLPTLFISTNAGTSWRVLTTQLPQVQALAADPKVRGRLLAGTFGGLFVSEDRGANWRLLTGGLPDGAVIQQFVRNAHSATWYAATRAHGIFRSVNGGTNWTLLPGAPDPVTPAIAIDPRTPGALFAAFQGQGIWLWTP
jgi:photosystem II stability/assembly factor-like uncharacterized protein